MEPLAHSARFEKNIGVQTYREHVKNVISHALANVRSMAQYYNGDCGQLEATVHLASVLHDLGKLEDENQKILKSGKGKRLPIDHKDAGSAKCMSQGKYWPACLICSHHGGLPDIPYQRTRGDMAFRSESKVCDGTCVVDITKKNLPLYVKKHTQTMNFPITPLFDYQEKAFSPMDLRLLLSTLVDADHSDTARHYGNDTEKKAPSLLPSERLKKLDEYVRGLSQNKVDDRTRMRTEVYKNCRDADLKPDLYACDSPVGTGKTTAVMAHLLKVAAERDLRRIFVVLPFTNIIDQSVSVYRKALVLQGENPEEVVAAHHHKAEFEDPASRQFSFLWHAPIIVVTAVQFFETLASKIPSALRKLHQLPGSAVFFDEAHAALPPHLIPQGWRWMNYLREVWGCHLVLGSGSLNRFWQLDEFSTKKGEGQPVTPLEVPDLLPEVIRSSIIRPELKRICYKTIEEKLDLQELLDLLNDMEGPRLLIVNTVQSAAVIAKELADHGLSDRHKVEHLSTALTPVDRKKTLERVELRLRDKNDLDWTLVATSCVEAGVDLSFRNGLRERASLNSLIQTGGRINRQNIYKDSCLLDFQLIHNDKLKANSAYKISSHVLGDLFAEDKVAPEYSTEAMKREIRAKELNRVNREILEAESTYKFPLVEEEFKIIPDNTVTAIVDEKLIARIENYEEVSFREFQRFSVSIYIWNEEKYGLEELRRFPGIYRWDLAYDNFLGYMAGVLAAFYPDDGFLNA